MFTDADADAMRAANESFPFNFTRIRSGISSASPPALQRLPARAEHSGRNRIAK